MFKILQLPLSILNWFLPKVNFHLSIERKTNFKKNAFNTKFNKTALVSYLSDPFVSRLQNKHTNHLECAFAAKTLSEMGYNVDVIDFDHHKKIHFKQYDVIYGFGHQFEQSFYDLSFKGKRIVYSPGCNTVYSNLVSCLRLKDFVNSGGILNPKLIRTTNDAWPLQKYLSDAIICLGNEFVLNSYKDPFEQTKYHQINCFPLDCNQAININQKDFSTAKYNLLWFGSQGSVHKGLDIVLHLVEKNPKLKLYIRGLNLKHEHVILEKFQHLIRNNQVDVKQHVDINSPEFVTIMQNCGGVIFPSASEGGAAALLTVMAHGGLIPIITKACGLDIEHLGFIANETTQESVEAQLDLYLKTKDLELGELSKRIRQEVTEHYSQEFYKNQLKKILNKIMQS
jgi:glycosyltransferase involved in cell wall biosynthesis